MKNTRDLLIAYRALSKEYGLYSLVASNFVLDNSADERFVSLVEHGLCLDRALHNLLNVPHSNVEDRGLFNSLDKGTIQSIEELLKSKHQKWIF